MHCRHIRRQIVPFIVVCTKRPVRIPVIIRDRDHIGVTCRVCIRSLPYTFQGIPHGCLIGKEHHLQTYFYVIPDTVLDLDQQPVQPFMHIVCLPILSPIKLPVDLVDQFAIIF